MPDSPPPGFRACEYGPCPLKEVLEKLDGIDQLLRGDGKPNGAAGLIGRINSLEKDRRVIFWIVGVAAVALIANLVKGMIGGWR